jgi:hypothetical protein
MVGYLQSQNYTIQGVDGALAARSISPDAGTSADLKADPGHAFIHTNRQILGNESGVGNPWDGKDLAISIQDASNCLWAGLPGVHKWT